MLDPNKVLTPTETKVLYRISLGESSKEVAGELTINKRTVDFHLANIYKKYNVHNRVQALRIAERTNTFAGVSV